MKSHRQPSSHLQSTPSNQPAKGEPTKEAVGSAANKQATARLRSRSSVYDPEQVWLQPYPKGNLQRLTNDLDGYKSLSLTSDGKVLAAVQAQNLFTIIVPRPAPQVFGGD
jgi:hypothetical protein